MKAPTPNILLDILKPGSPRHNPHGLHSAGRYLCQFWYEVAGFNIEIQGCSPSHPLHCPALHQAPDKGWNLGPAH